MIQTTNDIYLNFDILVYIRTVVVERDKGEPGDVDAVNLDTVHHLLGQVEDGVLVWFDRLGGVNDKHERRIKDLVALRPCSCSLTA